MRILKFGGSSVGSAERIVNVCDIVETAATSRGPVIVVCSAVSSVTDNLIAMAKAAASGDSTYLASLQNVKTRHEEIAHGLLGAHLDIQTELHTRFGELGDILRGIFFIRECTPRTLDLITSFGERLSCLLVATALTKRGKQAEFVDAREIIKTDTHFGSARVDFLLSNKLITERFPFRLLEPEWGLEPARVVPIAVVTGFIGSTASGETTTLGRGGSDYTASILGAALGAEEVEIWTDVSGVMTADPRKVKTAFVLDRMSYEEAMELSHFGAKVIHPPTMIPAMNAHIPLRIKNTFAPDDAGTLIMHESNGKFPIKGISSIDHIVLFRVEGPGMVGVPGIAGRVFGCLAKADVNVILITQASSEHSICFAVKPEDEAHASQALEKELAPEVSSGQIASLIVEPDRAIVAVVGEHMRQTPGIGARAFDALAEAQINVIAVAQGSSERNISIVVDSKDVTKSLTVLHAAFFEPHRLSVFLIGTGLVGSTLLKLMRGQGTPPIMGNDRFVVRGIMNSRQMIFQTDGLDPTTAIEQLGSNGVSADTIGFIETIAQMRFGKTVVVDCTASDVIPTYYSELLRSGISVVTSNKKGLAGPQALFDKIREAETQTHCLHETTVGAGLPTIRTVRDLVQTGDRIIRIEGILSGTMSYLFNTFQDGMKFSELVLDAKAKGYTEPDPRDDLSGMDVARKLVILARSMGLKMEVPEVYVEAILPECGFTDEEMTTRIQSATRDGNVLRYIAKLEEGRASVSLQAVGPDHPCYSLSGADNVFSFTTKRYATRPLVIKGPGAGAEVTAAGVLSDILSLI